MISDPDRLTAAARMFNLRLIALFGSRATGSPPPGPDSDADVAVLGCPTDAFWSCHAPGRLPGVDFEPVNDLHEVSGMLSERIESWEQQWEKRGIEKGLQQGLQQGEALFLKRQLIRRFGPLPDWVEAKLTEVVPAQLERWGERALDAPSLTAVFEGDR